MPAPLDPTDDQARCQIRAPKRLIDRITALLRAGETLSGVTRQLWAQEIAKRENENKKGKK